MADDTTPNTDEAELREALAVLERMTFSAGQSTRPIAYGHLRAVLDAARRTLPSTAQPDPRQDTRDPGCVARWPGCYSFGYDPRCCRFPKSCSAENPGPLFTPEQCPNRYHPASMGDHCVLCGYRRTVEVVHGAPTATATPCCGRTPFELPKTDRLTTDPDQVTCTGGVAS